MNETGGKNNPLAMLGIEPLPPNLMAVAILD
jgi:hypothetical protein